MIILGINAFHGDSSAALIRDGALIAAAEEERFRRIKHWAGFPSESIAYCLREAGVSASDVDHLAVNQDDHAHFFRKMAFLITAVPDLGSSSIGSKSDGIVRACRTCWPRHFMDKDFEACFTQSSITLLIWLPLFTFLHSRKPQLFHWTGLEIFPAPHGALVLART